ncbi:D-alanine--D-alanine ligase [bioreactor metagenome]|uniref:D-alanine--D-alanine ligase n=1 Tax=bioreactor metagenome TaxID=1076179 RepID=A0A644ZRG0_9ZZZZ
MHDLSLERLWAHAEEKLEGRHLILVCNTKMNPNTEESRGQFNMDTEYFSDEEFEQVVSMFGSLGLATDYFTYEDDFFRYVIEHMSPELLVYNAAQSGTGPGRKSLVPAFCNLHRIPCTGSNAYVVSLCRHKYHVNQILAQAGIKVPQTWLYSNGWLMERHPPLNMQVLLKPIYESASIGIDDTSIQLYTPQADQLIFQRMEQQHQPIIAQEFISGYEVEVPLLRVNGAIYQLPPIGISVDGKHNLGRTILNYERIYFDRYGFYDFAAEKEKISNELCLCAVETAQILDMEGLCRVDFRVRPDGCYYVTDVSTNPHFVAHSSVNSAFQILGLSPEHIAKTLLAATVEKG